MKDVRLEQVASILKYPVSPQQEQAVGNWLCVIYYTHRYQANSVVSKIAKAILTYDT